MKSDARDKAAAYWGAGGISCIDEMYYVDEMYKQIFDGDR